MKNSKYIFLNLMMLIGINAALWAQTDVNKLDEKGLKHGVWKGTYPESKRPRYEGTFDHGKEIGTFTYYDDTKAKSVIATREFNPQDHSVYTIFYDQAKNKVSEGKEINKIYEGQWKYYHQASPQIMNIENYKNGKLEGIRKVFYPDGTLAEEANYTNGVRNGLYKSYSVSKVVLEESNYKNGQYDGKAIYRESTGNMASQGIYVNGKKRGIWQFYKNGKLDKEVNMSKVKKLVKPKTK